MPSYLRTGVNASITCLDDRAEPDGIPAFLPDSESTRYKAKRFFIQNMLQAFTIICLFRHTWVCFHIMARWDSNAVAPVSDEEPLKMKAAVRPFSSLQQSISGASLKGRKRIRRGKKHTTLGSLFVRRYTRTL